MDEKSWSISNRSSLGLIMFITGAAGVTMSGGTFNILGSRKPPWLGGNWSKIVLIKYLVDVLNRSRSISLICGSLYFING